VLSGCSFTVTGTVAPGETVSIQGTGFQPDAELPVSVNGTVVATVVIQNGGVLPPTDITIPADAEFPIVITVPCSGGPGSGTATSTFSDPGVEDALAATGSDASNYVAIGLAALVVGGVLVLGSRRRSALSARKLGV
jgi:LPXTG-motif cell wall-anchored protein